MAEDIITKVFTKYDSIVCTIKVPFFKDSKTFGEDIFDMIGYEEFGLDKITVGLEGVKIIEYKRQ